MSLKQFMLVLKCEDGDICGNQLFFFVNFCLFPIMFSTEANLFDFLDAV